MLATYVATEDWNQLISDPDVVLVDTRNYYEYAIGTFKKCHKPQPTTFREFPNYVAEHLNPNQHKSRYVFSGGIRCEKIHRLLKTTRF